MGRLKMVNVRVPEPVHAAFAKYAERQGNSANKQALLLFTDAILSDRVCRELLRRLEIEEKREERDTSYADELHKEASGTQDQQTRLPFN